MAAALCSAPAFPVLAQFRVEISGVGAKQMPVAIAPFRAEAAGNAATSSIVKADLERSGLFKLLTPVQALDDRSPLPQAEMRAAGADALLTGSSVRMADGTHDIRYRLWDAVKGQELLARAVTVPGDDLRLAAHRVADEVYEKLTGDRGVFATRIAYVTKSARQFVLHVADSDGEGGRVALTSAEPIISPAWAPNGRDLAYVSFESGKAVVWVQDLQTGRRSTIANFPGTNSAPAWAPGGNQLAVTLSRDSVAQLYLINREGGQPRRLTVSSAIDTEPVFAPDGRQIYFRQRPWRRTSDLPHEPWTAVRPSASPSKATTTSARPSARTVKLWLTSTAKAARTVSPRKTWPVEPFARSVTLKLMKARVFRPMAVCWCMPAAPRAEIF